jgi:urease accessory protein UreF
MPTNKLWLEHTERAAWESVEALREKLIEAEKRIERLAPPLEGWSELLATLDAVREERGLDSNNYGALIRDLIERMTAADANARVTEGELAREREKRSVPAGSMRAVARTLGRDSADELPAALMADEDEYESGAGAQFLRALWRRYRTHQREASRVSLNSLVLAIEGEVDQLAELDEAELPEAALTLAVLAMRLEHEARKRSRAERA